jgi:membrane carboxypeptidase/penicillin-binding protein PbpC
VVPHPTTLTWLVDGAPVGRTSSDRALDWPLVVGSHDIEARAEDGSRARTSVVVK